MLVGAHWPSAQGYGTAFCCVVLAAMAFGGCGNKSGTLPDGGDGGTDGGRDGSVMDGGDGGDSDAGTDGGSDGGDNDGGTDGGNDGGTDGGSDGGDNDGGTDGGPPVYRGRVVEVGSGAPVAGAAVHLGEEFGQVTSATTDSDGYFETTLDPDEVTHLSVDAAGYLKTHAVGDDFAGFWLGFQTTVAIESDPTPSDVDLDGLSSTDEMRLETDPLDDDTDDDGIPDNVEAMIVPPFGAPALGASPVHRDLFWELDWAEDASDPTSRPIWAPTQDMLDVMAEVWTNAPLSNPDGTTGVRTVLDDGRFGGGAGISIPSMDYCSDYPQIDQAIAPGRRAYFFHAIFLEDELDSFGCADGRRQWGQGTLGPLLEAGAPAILEQLVPGIDVERAMTHLRTGTIVHELGHSLGLQHGGDTFVNCKPNYPSVMSYNNIMALGGVPAFFDGTFGINFSDGDEPPIDERAKDEMNPPFHTGAVTFDFNLSGTIDSGPVSSLVNVNGFAPFGQYGAALEAALGVDRCPDDGTTQVLEDHDDWAAMDFDQPPLP